MGKAKRPKVDRTEADINQLFFDAVDELSTSCSRFDRKDTREYRRMAAILRSLCRDTGMSHSLLGQVGLKGRNFLTSSPVIKLGNKLSECHLVGLVLRPNLSGKPAAWQAMLDDAPMEFQSFDDWLNAPVMVQPDGNSFSRAELVGYVADQDGGVHVDPAIDEAFDSMRRDAFTYTNGRETTENVDRHMIRQIAHEMLKSLRPTYKRKLEVKGAHSLFVAPNFAEVGAPVTEALVGYHKTPAEVDCPCGSGVSFSKCHQKGVIVPDEMQQMGGEFVAPPGAAYARVGFGMGRAP